MKKNQWETVKRDMDILQLIFEHKVLTRVDIGDAFFLGRTRQVTNRRLKKLCDLGLLKRGSVCLNNRLQFVYSITGKGLNQIRALTPYLVTGRIIRSDSVIHDLTLYRIRKRFLEFHEVQEYHTENILQSCKEFKESRHLYPFVDLRSDAYLTAKKKYNTLNIAVEYDASTKSQSRYFRKIRDYYRTDYVDGVLYIAKTKHTLKAVKKAHKTYLKDKDSYAKFRFILLDDFLEPKEQVRFDLYSNKFFTLNESVAS